MSSESPNYDVNTREAALERHRLLAAGALALPNLFLRSALTLFLLYGMLTLVLISMVQFNVFGPEIALLIGVLFAVLQFTLGPWLMDLSLTWLYKMRWVGRDELPEHLEQFVQRVCDDNRMKFPSFGIIDDGAPQAFTYGHHPSNARVVVSRGLFELLNTDEVEAVVAHELGHARNWDMALMTLANLVPLLLFYLYRIAIRYGDGDRKGKGAGIAIAIGAYVLYVISEYIVLWFSRTREYYADRFAGEVTGNPNALGRALIKIAYGLAAQDSHPQDADEADADAQKKKKKELAGVGPLGALNIFDRRAAVNMVMSSAGHGGATVEAGGVDLERVKGAMQWDLWNPWAGWYELNSTHPLVAKRLLYLSDQAAVLGQTPLVVFDRKKPESYWDEFAVDVCVLALPFVGLLGSLAAFAAAGLLANVWVPALLGVAVALLGVGCLVRTLFSYRQGIFENQTVASLLGHVKVSPVRPVLATLTGTIIGKGVPGLIYSEDFVLRDPTGIIFLDYQQPLAIWNFLFGLFRAGRYQKKEVRVTGWFRRAPVPYLEVKHLEVIDGSEPARTTYSYHASLIGSTVVTVLGIGLAVWLAMAF